MRSSSIASTGRSGAARATTARTTASGGELTAAGVPISQHPLPLIPPHRVLEGRLRRPPAIAELADGLVAREVHAMPGHAHALDREARSAGGEAREDLGSVRKRSAVPDR